MDSGRAGQSSDQVHAGQPAIGPAGDYLLVVDDDPDICEMVEEMVSTEGYAVRTARNGRVAIGILREFAPALVLLDLVMPDINGVEFLDELERLRIPPPPVVMFTALAESVPAELAQRVADVLGKPVLSDELIAMIRKHWRS